MFKKPTSDSSLVTIAAIFTAVSTPFEMERTFAVLVP